MQKKRQRGEFRVATKVIEQEVKKIITSPKQTIGREGRVNILQVIQKTTRSKMGNQQKEKAVR